MSPQPQAVAELAPPAGVMAGAVEDRELLRLLGMPRGASLEGDARLRAEAARAWYATHGRPFAAARRLAVAGLSDESVRLEDGTVLRSRALAEALRAADGQAVVALGVSAGCEVAAEASRLWAAERPDEAYFLDRFATAVTEALVLWAAGALCREATPSGEALLPPRSPGCGDFAIGDQQRLMRLLGGEPVAVEGSQATDERLRLGAVELLATGALDPPHSLLAALGVTRQRRPLAAPTARELCRACSLDPCAFRRARFAPAPGAPSDSLAGER